MTNMLPHCTPFPAPLQVSMAPNKSQLIRHCTRLLSMVHELHKAGYQRLRAIPYLHFDNGCWRCPLTVADNITKEASEENGFCMEFRDESLVLHSSNGGLSAFNQISNAETMSARELAAAFIKHFPELAKRCEGQDWAYAGWLTSILGVAESGLVPVLFGPRNELVAVVPKPAPCSA